MSTFRIPNVLILGTPGSGKSTLCQKVLQNLTGKIDSDRQKKLNITHLNVADLISEKCLYSEWDHDMDCSVYDQELLEKELDSYDFNKGGLLVEFHSCEFFENDQFDRVYVLLTQIDILYQRLEKRNYSDQKIKRNIECEIFQTCLYDSYDVFDRDKVETLDSNNEEDLEKNVTILVKYLSKTKQ